MYLYNYVDIFLENVKITNTTLVVGETGTVTCVVTLNTPLGPDTSSLLINWIVSNKSITNDTRNQIILERKSKTVFHSVLTTSNVSETDGGEYKCTADIAFSKSKEVTGILDICVKGELL